MIVGDSCFRNEVPGMEPWRYGKTEWTMQEHHIDVLDDAGRGEREGCFRSKRLIL